MHSTYTTLVIYSASVFFINIFKEGLTMKKLIHFVFASIFMLTISGCVSLGQKIDYNKVSMIQKRVTTEADIRAMFGEPVTSQMNLKRGVKILTYGYKNSDEVKKVTAGTAGMAVGGALGSQIGGGSGSVIAGSLGALAGGFLASNAVTSREEEQYLEVTIGLKSKKVIDFNYVETKGRSQKIGVNSGVAPL